MSGTAIKAIVACISDYITKPGLKTYVIFDATVPFQSIRQSRIMGLSKLTNCHDCHSHFGKVTKPFLDSEKSL